LQNKIKTNIGLIKWFYQALVYSFSRLLVLKISPIREELLNQLESAGVKSLGIVGVIATLAGTLIIDQSIKMVGAAGEVSVKLLGWSLFGEAGALFVGFLIAARVAPTMAASLALMRFRGEFGRLESLSISIADYLVVPRVIALISVSVLLSVYFMACALLGGMLIASFLRDFSFVNQIGRFFEIVNPMHMLIALLKCGFFGGIVAVVSCYQGLMIERDAKRLSDAGSEALTLSILILGVIEVGSIMLSALIK
jgi:phospholipid/cholesterol/gamma-HCH transport system permease protein